MFIALFKTKISKWFTVSKTKQISKNLKKCGKEAWIKLSISIVRFSKIRLWVSPDSGSSPGDQVVTEEFSMDWDWVLAGSEQVIVARLDGRGSGFRGQRYCGCIQNNSSTFCGSFEVSVIEYTLKIGPQHFRLRLLHYTLIILMFVCHFTGFYSRSIRGSAQWTQRTRLQLWSMYYISTDFCPVVHNFKFCESEFVSDQQH